jgi:leader peptidase (prepilin peptidase) / N-methyltransferase
MEIHMLIYYILVGLLGLLIGSFLNVCIYRIPIDKSIISPPSSCGSCGKRLSALDLVPVFSYLFLRGKCRHCGVKFSSRYAFVELITSIVFVVLFYKYNSDIWTFIFYTFFMSVLLVVFFIDLDHKIIPYRLVIAALVGGITVFIYNIFNNMEIYSDDKWWNPLVGMISGSGFLFLVALIGLYVYKTDDAMGMGDVNIFAPIGLFLGWRLTLLTLFMAVVIAGIISLFLIIFKIKGRKDGIPFGPFIVTAVFISFLVGNNILDWYLAIGANYK